MVGARRRHQARRPPRRRPGAARVRAARGGRGGVPDPAADRPARAGAVEQPARGPHGAGRAHGAAPVADLLGRRALPLARFGVPLAWLLARVPFRGRNLVRALVLLPMVLPPVVGGVALLLAFGRNGIAGRWLDSLFGVTLPFSTAGAMLAETFVAMPFLVITVEAGIRAMDRRYEDAAAHPGRRPVADVPPGHPAADRPRAGGGARSAGRAPWASSAPRSRSPATCPAPPRPCRSPSTWRCRTTPTPRSP